MEHTYKISFRSGEISFEIESNDKSWLEKKEKEYLSFFSEKTIHKGKSVPHPLDTKTVTPSASLTINEFYRKYVKGNNITKRPDIAVFLVYYLQKIQKSDSIKSGDIAKCFGDVSYPGYNKLNVTDILNQAKRRALLNYVNSLWSLTITGEDFVVNLLTSETK